MSAETFHINRDFLLEQAASLGLEISATTLNRYVKSKLITPPERGSLGRGLGKFSFYHEGAHVELSTVYCLMSGFIPQIRLTSKAKNIPLYTLPKVQSSDLMNARERFVGMYLTMENGNPYKKLLHRYCKGMIFLNLPIKSGNQNSTLDLNSLLDECAYLEQTFDKSLVDMMKDELLDGIIQSDPQSWIYQNYKALFIRFSLLDQIKNTQTKNNEGNDIYGRTENEALDNMD